MDIVINFKYLEFVLLHLCNVVFNTGNITGQLKITYLKPINKSGKKDDCNSYRPIGSISVFTKIIEHHNLGLLVTHRAIEYLTP